MPVNTHSSRTFGRLMVEVAQAFGLASYGPDGTGPASLPASGTRERQRLEWAVNRGYRTFLQHDPNWSFRRTFLEWDLDPNNTAGLVDNTKWRYFLPPYISSPPEGQVQYLENNSAWRTMTIRTPQQIIEANRRKNTIQAPTHFAAQKISDKNQPPGRSNVWELLVFPQPDRVYRVGATFRIQPYDLVDVDEEHVAGSEHDMTVVAFAKLAFAEEDESFANKIATYRESVAQTLAASMREDISARGKGYHGKLVDPSWRASIGHADGMIPRGYVREVGGISIPPPFQGV